MCQSADSEKAVKEDLPGVYIKTFGCQMNEYDSEKMLALLSNTYRLVSTPALAQLVLVNTCSVREKAESKLYSFLGTLKALKQKNPGMIIGVGGCVAQQEGDALLKRRLGVDFVVGTHNISLIPSLVERAKNGATAVAVVDYREEWEEFSEETLGSSLPTDVPTKALVAIQRGCNKRCSFCVVPGTRGPQVSRPIAEVLKEVRTKVLLGAKEVLLLGQTVNSYGSDLGLKAGFESLLREVAGIEGVKRIRFTSPHPSEVSSEFLRLYGELPELCPHIHLPLQSGSNRILKLMRRGYTRERFLLIAQELKKQCPNIGITTDLIVGFPTETQSEFEETLEVMREVRFCSAFSFKYSSRPHTKAQSQYSAEDLVTPEVAGQRLLCLQKLQDELSLEFNSALLGKTLEVLVEGQDKKISSSGRGRIPQNTPVEIANCQASVGDLTAVVISHATPHGLRGECA